MKRLVIPGLVFLALLLLVAAGFLILPQIVSARIADTLQRTAALSFSQQGRGRLSFENGLAVVLTDVVVAPSDGQSVPFVTAREMIIPGLAGMLPGAGLPAEITLNEALVSIVSQGAGAPPSLPIAFASPIRLKLSNTSVRYIDRQNSTVVSANDVQGEVVRTPEGALLIDARGLVNGLSTQATISIESADRVAKDGSPADLAFASGNHSLAFSGRLKAGSAPELVGVLTAQSDSLRGFLVWLGLPLAEEGKTVPFLMESPLSSSASTFALNNVQLTAGKDAGQGKLLIKTGQSKPVVSGELRLAVLDLNLFSAGAATPPDLSTDWTERPFSLADYFAIDTAIAVTAERLLVGAVPIENARLDLIGQGNTLRATLQNATLAGGMVRGQVIFGQDDTEARLDVDLALNGVAGDQVLERDLGIPRLSGSLDGTAKLTATGNSPAALVSTLKGNGQFTLRNGLLKGVDLPAVLASAQSQTQDGWPAAAPDTPFSDLSMTMDVADGVATLANAQLSGPKGTIAASGTFDLLRRAFALSLTPQGGQAVTLGGKWERPQFSAAGN